MKWRAAHHWLRGYSDAKARRGEKPLDADYAAEYFRGYKAGGGDHLPAYERWPDGAPT